MHIYLKQFQDQFRSSLSSSPRDYDHRDAEPSVETTTPSRQFSAVSCSDNEYAGISTSTSKTSDLGENIREESDNNDNKVDTTAADVQLDTDSDINFLGIGRLTAQIDDIVNHNNEDNDDEKEDNERHKEASNCDQKKDAEIEAIQEGTKDQISTSAAGESKSSESSGSEDCSLPTYEELFNQTDDSKGTSSTTETKTVMNENHSTNIPDTEFINKFDVSQKVINQDNEFHSIEDVSNQPELKAEDPRLSQDIDHGLDEKKGKCNYEI